MNESQNLTLILTVKDWNRIRDAMSEVPYKNIADLFLKMDTQFDVQLNPGKSEHNEEKQQEA